MLADPAYFEAIFQALPKVKELYKGQAELGLANESIASASGSNPLTHFRLMQGYYQIKPSRFKTTYTNYAQKRRMPSIRRRY